MLKLIFTKSWNNCHRPTLNPLLSLKAGFLTGNVSKNVIKFLSNLLVFTAELLNELRLCLWHRYRFAEFSLDFYLSSSFTSFSSLSWFAANMKKKKKTLHRKHLEDHSPATGEGFFMTHHRGFHCKRTTLVRATINASYEKILEEIKHNLPFFHRGISHYPPLPYSFQPCLSMFW